MARRKVETHRATASAAVFSIALAQRLEPLRILIATELPWVHEFDNYRSHGSNLNGSAYRLVSYGVLSAALESDALAAFVAATASFASRRFLAST